MSTYKYIDMVKTDFGLNKVDELILDVIKKSDHHLSTYEISKIAKISWSTTNTHCYKLKSYGFIDGENKEVKIGMKRMIWWLLNKKVKK